MAPAEVTSRRRGPKSGLSGAWQARILAVLAASPVALDTATIGVRIGYPWYPQCSAVRVTLWSLVRQGRVRRVVTGANRHQPSRYTLAAVGEEGS